MTQSLALNGFMDLTVDESGNLAVASVRLSVAQDVACAVKTFAGEVYYDTTQGIPYFDDVLGQLPPASLLTGLIDREAVLRVAAATTANTTLTSFNDRDLSGQILINGTTAVGSDAL